MMLKESEIRELVRARDGYRCRDCGATNDEHLEKYGMKLSVHRLVRGSPYTLEGCVTLCNACHAGRPEHRPDESSNKVGSRLVALRRQAGLTQRQLAQRAHLHYMGIAKLEQGHRGAGVRHETLRRLAKALGVVVDELITGS